jgi:cysteine synthase
VIVEGTAGNTGIGLALVGNALGYRTVIVIPETQTQAKTDMLRLCGAELIEVPAVPYVNPINYVTVSGRIVESLAKSEPNGAIWANQFDNVANRDGHIVTPDRRSGLRRTGVWIVSCVPSGRGHTGRESATSRLLSVSLTRWELPCMIIIRGAS